MFGISFETWKEICNMYCSLPEGSKKAYLQWFPFSKITDADRKLLLGADFFARYIQSGGFVLFPEVMRHSENFIQKEDGSFRNASLISPILFLVLQCIGKEISSHYTPTRPSDIKVYYAGNYDCYRPHYKRDYDDFYKEINAGKETYQYYIKTDITGFYGNINVNELVKRIDYVCNKDEQKIPQAQLLLIKELLLYCGDGSFPLIENSMASSYLATTVYLDEVDSELYRFIKKYKSEITIFKMIRYVDDLYILFSSERKHEDLLHLYNAIKCEYSSILKEHSLSLNTRKCSFGDIGVINEELKKALYDENMWGIETDIAKLHFGSLKRFLEEICTCILEGGITYEQYVQLIEKNFSFDDVEYTASEVFNYLVYENQDELKSPDVSDLLTQIINTDISFLSIDPKRLSVMVMQSGNDGAIKGVLNSLFSRYRAGLWNSYDTTVSIAYLIQSKFQHKGLLNVIREKSLNLYHYYLYCCRESFTSQLKSEKENRYLRCIKGDAKASFLYFMSCCEMNRSNNLSSYAYYKNFFDRISADMAFLSEINKGKKGKPDYNAYYKEHHFKSLYSNILNSNDIIKKAHALRNANPLTHSSASLIDIDSSSKELRNAIIKLDLLIDQFSKTYNL